MAVRTEKAKAWQRTPPPTLLMTKLHPPPRAGQTVARDRLVERLRAGPGSKLTLVAAPAGCGKTTLLGTWRELEEAARPVAWLTLDEGDNDPVVLWSYVLAALRGVCPTLGVSSRPSGGSGIAIVDVVLPELVNELTALGDAALVLDDFHRLSNGPARDSLAWFVDRAPSTFQLVLATRSEPALPSGGAARPRRAARAASRRARLHSGRGGRAPERSPRARARAATTSTTLVERTEGWPAGLYLAALSLRAVEDRQAFVSRFGGKSRHVVDFLVDEVLEAHDPATQALMLRSSMLERLCGPLCDAVLEQRRLRQAAGRARAHEPVPPAARRLRRVVPLPPPLRAAAARRARAPRARPRADAPPARIRVASRPRLGRRGDRARARGRRVRRGGRADRGRVGRLRERRSTRDGSRLARAVPARAAARGLRGFSSSRPGCSRSPGKREAAAEAIAAIELLGRLDAGAAARRLQLGRGRAWPRCEVS